MTDERKAEIRAMLDAATPGVWGTAGEIHSTGEETWSLIAFSGDGRSTPILSFCWVPFSYGNGGMPPSDGDTELICSATTVIRELLDELEARR